MYIVQGLSLYRDKKRILDDVSFQVQRGEYLALIGPNGAGKSTLLKCLDKIATKSQGDIFFDGKSLDLISQKSLARRVAYVQQSLPTTFSFTVRQFVEMGRFPHLAALSPITQTDQDIVTE